MNVNETEIEMSGEDVAKAILEALWDIGRQICEFYTGPDVGTGDPDTDAE